MPVEQKNMERCQPSLLSWTCCWVAPVSLQTEDGMVLELPVSSVISSTTFSG